MPLSVVGSWEKDVDHRGDLFGQILSACAVQIAKHSMGKKLAVSGRAILILPPASMAAHVVSASLKFAERNFETLQIPPKIERVVRIGDSRFDLALQLLKLLQHECVMVVQVLRGRVEPSTKPTKIGPAGEGRPRFSAAICSACQSLPLSGCSRQASSNAAWRGFVALYSANTLLNAGPVTGALLGIRHRRTAERVRGADRGGETAIIRKALRPRAV
jgi:hypothetical protein